MQPIHYLSKFFTRLFYSFRRLPYGDADSFVLTATDQRSRKKATAVVVVARGGEGSGAPQAVSFADAEDSISLLGRGDQTKSDPVARIRTNIDPPEGLFFSMTDNSLFEIDSSNGDVFRMNKYGPKIARDVTVTVRQLANWQQTKSKTFRIVGGAAGERGSSLNAFTEEKVSFTIKEDAPVKSTTVKICPVRVTSNVFIKIISGNGENIFSYDERRRVLILSKSLDFERREEHQVVLKMGSSGGEFSLCKVRIAVEDVNDNAPVFPSCKKEFAVTVPENSPRGFRFGGPPVVDLDSGDRLLFWISNTRQFDVQPDTGVLTTRAVFDYESSVAHRLIVHANDSAGHESSCNVLVLVGSVDEYAPAFDQTNYYFSLPGLASGSPGDVVGQVRARDRDRGPDGVVTFELTEPSDYFAVDALRGVITVSKTLDTGVLDYEANVVRKKRSLRDVRLAVRAKSRQPDSLEATAVVTMSVEENLLPVAVRDGGEGSAGWVAGVLVAILLVIIVIAAFFFCRKKMKKDQQRKFGGVGTSASVGVGGQVNAGMTASDSMELSSNGTSSVTNLSRFPPQYSEIIADYDSRNPKAAKAHHGGGGGMIGGNSRSEISEKSHRSASSGRGSVEDCDEEVDSEIRMINEGGCYLGAAAATAASDLIDAPPDKSSDTASVQNTEEYLARLGIDIRKPPNLASATGSHHGGGGGDMVHNFGGSHYGGGGGGSSIYNRIADDALSEKNSVLSAKHSASVLYGATGRVIGGGGGGGQPSLTGSLSSIVHSEEELAGSYNWDYLLDWGPQYQSLAHVFKEISKLKDDSVGPAGGNGMGRHGPGLSVSAVAGASAPPSAFPQRGFPSPSSVPAPQSYGLARNPHTSHLQAHRSTRSPISQLDSMGPHSSSSAAGRGALSPNFHPSLSPLAATKSPSVSPMAVAMSGGGGGGQQNRSVAMPPQRM